MTDQDEQCMICFDHGDSSGAGELVHVHRRCLELHERGWDVAAMNDLLGKIPEEDLRLLEMLKLDADKLP